MDLGMRRFDLQIWAQISISNWNFYPKDAFNNLEQIVNWKLRIFTTKITMAMPNLEAAVAAEHTISNKKAAVKKTQFGEFLPKSLTYPKFTSFKIVL